MLRFSIPMSISCIGLTILVLSCGETEKKKSGKGSNQDASLDAPLEALALNPGEHIPVGCYQLPTKGSESPTALAGLAENNIWYDNIGNGWSWINVSKVEPRFYYSNGTQSCALTGSNLAAGGGLRNAPCGVAGAVALKRSLPTYNIHGANTINAFCAPTAGCYGFRDNANSPGMTSVFFTNGQGQSCKVRGDRVAATCPKGVELSESYWDLSKPNTPPSSSSGATFTHGRSYMHVGAEFAGACAGSEGVEITDADRKVARPVVADAASSQGAAASSPDPQQALAAAAAEAAAKAAAAQAAAKAACIAAVPNALTTILHIDSRHQAYNQLVEDWRAGSCVAPAFDPQAGMISLSHTDTGCDNMIITAFERYLHKSPTADEIAVWGGKDAAGRADHHNCRTFNVGMNIKSYSKQATFQNDGSGYGQWSGGCPEVITNAFWKYLKRAPSGTELYDWASSNCDKAHLDLPWERNDPGNNVYGWTLIPRYLNRMYWNPAGDSHAAAPHFEFAAVDGGGVYRNLERITVNEAGTQILGRRRDNGFLHVVTYGATGWGGGDFTDYSIDKVVQARSATINNYVIRTSDGSVIAKQYNGSGFTDYRLPDIDGQRTNLGILDVATNADGTFVLGASPNGIRAWTFVAGKGWNAWQFSNSPTTHVRMPINNAGLAFALLKSPSAYNGRLLSFYLNCAATPCKWTELGEPTNLGAKVKHSFQFRDFDVSNDGRFIHGTLFEGQTHAGTWSYVFDKEWGEAQVSTTTLVNIKTRGDGAGFYGVRRDDGLTWNSSWWSDNRWLNGNTFSQAFEGALTPDGNTTFYTSPIGSPNVLTGN